MASTRVPLLDLSSATAGIAPWILKLARGQHALAVETTVTGCGGLAVRHPSKQQLRVARRGTRHEDQLSNSSKSKTSGRGSLQKKLGQASMDGGILAEVRAKSERAKSERAKSERAKSERAKRASESASPVSNGDRRGA